MVTASYVLRRLSFAIVTLFLAATLDFALPRLVGGNPAQYIASQTALGSPTVARALAKEFDLHSSNPLGQYFSYLGQIAHGNLGVSYEYFPRSVISVLAQALPYTLGLVLTATVISFLVGWGLGILAAWRQRSAFDETVVGVSFFLHAMPYFWTAMVLLFVFAFGLGWFPMGHAFSSSVIQPPLAQRIVQALYHGILPVCSLVLASAAGHLLVMRNNMLATLREDYVVFAKARGISGRRLALRYAARTALLPSFTGLMLSLGTVVGGAIVTEIVFSYPGVGFVTYNAILSHDYPMIQGGFLLLAVSVIVLNLLADLLYPLLDPRVVLS